MLLLCLVAHGQAETKPPANALDHWAFHPPRAVTPPAVKNQRWVKTDIDRFILSRLKDAGVAPAPAADLRTLIRRMSFDLTGLPPTFEEVGRFEKEAAVESGRAAHCF